MMSTAMLRGALARLAWFSAFAMAMALVEAAIVIYLRAIYYADDPLRIFPLRLLSNEHLLLEFAREAATLAMLLAVAATGTTGCRRRFAAFVFLFGVWDLAYYGWLRLFVGWPLSWLEWDLLFLIPWPWLGPWISAALVALLFAAWGGYALVIERDPVFDRWSVALFCSGALFVLGAFLAPAWPQLLEGREAVAGFVPNSFAWGVYATGLLGMIAGLVRSALRTRS
jgi:hypothetical protein